MANAKQIEQALSALLRDDTILEREKMSIVWLGQPLCQNIPLCGAKAALLSRLSHDYPVLPGFCVTTQAQTLWCNLDGKGGVSGKMQTLLRNAYHTLLQRCPIDSFSVFVSLSTTEEAAQRSLSLHQECLCQRDVYQEENLIGPMSLYAAVNRCWTATQREAPFSDAGWKYRPSVVFSPLAILVQQFIPAEVSFTAYSVNPARISHNEVLIHAIWGLSKSLLCKTVMPDTYTVSKGTCRLLHQTIAEKERMTVCANNGIQEIATPRLLRKNPVLHVGQSLEIAQLVSRLEAEMKGTVKVEGAYWGEKLYLYNVDRIRAC